MAEASGADRQLPADALRALASQLPGGVRTTLRSDRGPAVLSTPAASVWSNGRIFWWATSDDGDVTWPAADAPGAARQLTDCSKAFVSGEPKILVLSGKLASYLRRPAVYVA